MTAAQMAAQLVEKMDDATVVYWVDWKAESWVEEMVERMD